MKKDLTIKRDICEDFREEYSRLHSYCPKCGDKYCTQTLFGYVLREDKLEEYKNRNVCICSKCGDRHIVHDRISKEQISTIIYL